MAEKKTVMALKVDLQCPCCYKKIQKILCKIPQISDRYFDEKANTVIISVICCSPEKIRDKLLCKGGKIIKNIEIKEPPKPKDDKPKEAPKPKDDKPKEAPKPKDDKPKQTEQKPKEAEKQKESEKPKETAKPKSNGKGNAPPPAAEDKPKDAPKNPAPGPAPGAIPVGLPPVHPVNTCCGPCYQGQGGGPCYHGYGFPPPPPQPCYDGNYGPGYVYGRPCYVSRCDYFSEENSTGCTIM